jgi:exopolysaccharide biosynthesis polyprenyl glycosylphosphotransferase
MLRQFSTRRIIGFFLLDWLGTLGLLLASASLRVRLGDLPPWFVTFLRSIQIDVTTRWFRPEELIEFPVFVVVAFLWPFFFIIFSVYDGRHNQTLKAELLNVFLAICVSSATLAGVLYFSYRDTPRVLIVIFLILDLLLLLGSRVILWGSRQFQKGKRVDGKRNVVIIGAGPVGQNAVELFQKYAWTDLELLGFLDDDPSKLGQTFTGLPVIGALHQAADVVIEYKIQDAVIALPLRAHKQLIGICNLLQGLSVRVHVIPDLFALSFPNAELDGFGGIPVIHLGYPGLLGIRRVVKRAFDVIAVSVGLVLLSPVLLLIAIFIRLDSRGAIIYRQDRIGENGRLFTMFKFRSMQSDADPDVHKAYVTRLIVENVDPEQLRSGKNNSLKMEDDPRLTRLGRILRKTSLDELPQLLNVLRGDMSLVGPRPPLPYEVEMYQDWHKRRFGAPPGITGLWQVKGRNMVSFDEMVRMDLEYIEKQSIWLDLSILFQTPWAVISARGAG